MKYATWSHYETVEICFIISRTIPGKSLLFIGIKNVISEEKPACHMFALILYVLMNLTKLLSYKCHWDVFKFDLFYTKCRQK